MKLTAITLDVTHTLLECPCLGEIYAEVLERHGVHVEAAAVRRTIPVVWRELSCAAPLPFDRFASHPDGPQGWWRRFIERTCELLDAERPSRFAAVELFDRFARPESWRVFPEVPATLAELRRRGFRLAVVSNWDTRLPLLLARLGLAESFEAIVVSAAVGREKPDRVIFDTALAALGVAAEAALHVGDHPLEDVEGARAAGMQALHLDRSGGGGDLADLAGLVPWLVARGATGASPISG